MAMSEDLINFDLIETHKENIQQLPGGRSAKQLAAILSPLPSARTGGSPTLDETKTLNDAIRQEYENELQSIADSDDPLDIYDRYVKWTLNAYPSAQATPQSQLLPLLERATKSFLTSSHYKNDPRYLKLWLHYIRLFSDAPRETFAFLARHHIGEGLGLFYEEFAAWLEGAERWNQADEVYRMGIEKEARPAERLLRKYNQFQERYSARPEAANEPSSPALPTVRPALAAKIDPFASTARTDDTQAQRPESANNTSRPKSGRAKMAIFSDADNDTPPPAASGTRGWDSIGSMKERKKENTIEARPWVGETLKAGKKVGTSLKMEVFKDPNAALHESQKLSNATKSDVINSRTGRAERVFVSLKAVYPDSEGEYSFEELRAMHRGWMSRKWKPDRSLVMQPSNTNVVSSSQAPRSTDLIDIENLSQSYQQKADTHDVSSQSIVGMPEPKSGKSKKSKVREVRQETQTVKTRLDSPTGPKIKRKGSSEPTMTFHSKAATNEIYDMFNQSMKPETKDDIQSGDDSDHGDEDDTYSTAGESANTGLISRGNSEFGDDTTRSFGLDNTHSQPESVSPWSDFTASKHVPKMKKNMDKLQHGNSGEFTDHDLESSQNQTMHTEGFDTQAIAALANQNFDDLDTKMIARLAGDDSNEDDNETENDANQRENEYPTNPLKEIETQYSAHEGVEDLTTPTNEDPDEFIHVEVQEKPRFVPLPPEDYDPTPMRPYRDPAASAQNKLPFMTPIAEKTESSLAPSTIYQDKDYDQVKTPSRSARSGYSPSKLQISELLMSSPAEEPSSSKRRRSAKGAFIANEDDQSPNKKHAGVPISVNQNIPFVVAKEEFAPSTLVEEDGPLAQNADVFEVAKPPQSRQISKIQAATKSGAAARTHSASKGPIIPDLQCNPVDPAIQQQILKLVNPAPSSYKGYHEHETTLSQHEVLKKFAKKERSTKVSPKKSPRKQPSGPVLNLPGASRVYVVKKELGTGAYAAVYLVESRDSADSEASTDNLDNPNQSQPDGTERHALEAMKTESPAVSLVWEFHVLHLLRSRLGPCARTMQSIVTAHECHLYRDECYLVLDYHSQGTVLDLVNKVRTDNSRAGKNVEGLDETVAMWLTVEVLRTMEEFHKVGILHGDLKIDNCLVRFEPNVELLSPYNRLGNDGWDSKGMMLIDFGRGVDIKAFKPEARFVADWKAEETDCAEIREARPWKWEIDLFGAAGIIHSLLFGKYIETVAIGGGGLGQKKEWKLKESFKRYWEKEIWHEVFHVLINGGGKDAEDIRKEIFRVRGMMEDWLETESERGGRDLRGSIRRCERLLGITGNAARGR